MQKTNNKKEETKQQPINSVQIGGIKVTTWENKGEDGKIFLNSTIKKNYYDEKSDKWLESTSLSVNDLLKLRVAIDETIKFCLIDSKEKLDEE